MLYFVSYSLRVDLFPLKGLGGLISLLNAFPGVPSFLLSISISSRFRVSGSAGLGRVLLALPVDAGVPRVLPKLDAILRMLNILGP